MGGLFMTIKETKRSAALSRWAGWIHERIASGQTIKEWCEMNGKTQHQYYYWLRELRTEALRETGSSLAPAPDIVQLQPERLRPETLENDTATETSLSRPAIRMKYRDAWIEIPDGMEPSTIASVLKALNRT